MGAPTPAAGPLLIALVTMVVLVSGAAWYLRYDSGFRSFASPDACDYAQMGRQLYRGEGFSSLQTFPYVLGWLEARGKPMEAPWPNITRFPLITLLNSISFRVFGANDRGVVAAGGVLLAMTGAATFLLGNRLFGALAGLVAALLIVTNPLQLSYSVSGLTSTGAGFFLVATAICLSVACESTRRPVLASLALGAVVGLGYLQRANLVVLVPVVLLLHWLGSRPRSLKVTAFILVGFAMSTGPWLLRNWIFFDSPLASLTADRALLISLVPGDPFYSFEQYDKLQIIVDKAPLIWRKIMRGFLFSNYHRLFGPELAWLAPAFLASVVAIRSRRVGIVWLLALLTFLVTTVLLLASYNEVRYYRPFAPLLLTVVVGSAVSVVRMLPRIFHLALPVVALVIVVSAVKPVVALRHRHILKQPAAQAILDTVATMVPSGGVVASNASWKLAWYSDLRSVRFAGSPEQLEILDRDYVQIDAVYMEGRRVPMFRKALVDSPIAPRLREVREFGIHAVLWLVEPAAGADPSG